MIGYRKSSFPEGSLLLYCHFCCEGMMLDNCGDYWCLNVHCLNVVITQPVDEDEEIDWFPS